MDNGFCERPKMNSQGGRAHTLLPSDCGELDLWASNNLVKKMMILGEDNRRLFFEQLVKAALRDHCGGQEFLSELMPPIHIRLDQRKTRVWREASKFFASKVRTEGKSIVLDLYENMLSGRRSKSLGQYFTPSHIAAFTLSGIKGKLQSILDPMAGHGVFLQLAEERYPSARLVGVDIDPLPLLAAHLRVSDKVDLVSADVFKWAKDCATCRAGSSFSAIVGNPAYVNYQTLSAMQQFVSSKAKNETNYKRFLLEALRDIAKVKRVESELKELLRSWSGLSDLSSYTLVLAWLMTDSDGQIAFVMSNHWMERNYGEGLRYFLASKGTVRGVVTHRGGNWFPRAQIPASVFVFSKGTISDRQKNEGIPYVEIEGPYVPDLGQYLKSYLGLDFWDWLDDVRKAGEYGPLSVSFRRWLRSHKDRQDVLEGTSYNLYLPEWFKRFGVAGLEAVGWSVHQGLRTGCNEVFYLEKVQGKEQQYLARLTKSGKRLAISLSIPGHLLMPTIRKLPHSARLVVNEKQTNLYLLNLNKALLEEDKESFYKYPEQWRRAWNFDSIKVLPKQLASYLREWATTPYEGKGRVRRPVMELSAVQTNVYKPPRESRKIPRPPRFWYQISLTERHFGELFIPRVSSGPVRGFLVRDPKSVVIDANYLTFTSKPDAIPSRRLWIWLNSNAFRILCERNGAALGGGALKVEATLLSRIPVPQSMCNMDEERVDQLSQMLEFGTTSDEGLIEIGRKIDEFLFGEDIASSNVALLKNLVNKRHKRS